MLAAPLLSSRRLVPALPPHPLGHLERRGGRAFQLAGGDQIWTLPDVFGPVCVLVPRGHGWPLLARRAGGAFRALPHGEPCAPGRWSVAGGVAARFRSVSLATGPALAVGDLDLGPGPRAGWLRLRVRDLAWSALRRRDPSAGHGVVVLTNAEGAPASSPGPGSPSSGRICGVSPLARTRGLVPGMSLALARRRCPSVRVLPAVDASGLRVELEAWLTEHLGLVERCRGGWLVAWPAPDTTSDPLGQVAWLVRRLWQGFGVCASGAVAPSRPAASALGRLLEPGEVASADPQSDAAWARRGAAAECLGGGAEGALWSGAPLPDVEGVVCRVEQLAALLLPAAEGRAVRLRLKGERQSATLRRALLRNAREIAREV